MKAHHVYGSGEKAKDPFFGLTMGGGSQANAEVFRHILIVRYCHCCPSTTTPSLLTGWALAFQISPSPNMALTTPWTVITCLCYNENTCHLWNLLLANLAQKKFQLWSRAILHQFIVKCASKHQDKLNDLILLNPPLTTKHANLPSTLAIFSNFLLGEIFSQDPLRASDKDLTSAGPYQMKEDDAMVYRRPHLTPGSSGFALNAISRTMKKKLKNYVEDMRKILINHDWKVKTTVCWGQRDRWLNYDGVEDFCKDSKHLLVELPMGITYRRIAVKN